MKLKYIWNHLEIKNKGTIFMPMKNGTHKKGVNLTIGKKKWIKNS